jgi:hypothetical protein
MLLTKAEQVSDDGDAPPDYADQSWTTDGCFRGRPSPKGFAAWAVDERS